MAEAGHHDRHLDRLAVAVAPVVLEGLRQPAQPEHPVAGLHVEQLHATGPHGGPTAHQEVAELLVAGIGRQVPPNEQRVEPLLLRDALQLVEHRQLVLPVGVHGEDQVVLVELALLQAPAEVGEREVVGGRHAAVAVERQHAGVATGWQPRRDLGSCPVGGTVVDHDELVDQRVQAGQDRGHRRRLVVGGDDGDASGVVSHRRPRASERPPRRERRGTTRTCGARLPRCRPRVPSRASRGLDR